jgi:hypothetical protein
MRRSEIDEDAQITVQEACCTAAGVRGAVLSPIESVDGVDAMAVASDHSPGSWFLGLSEKQTREAAYRLSAIVEKWDEEDDSFGR